jgi:hypothetical protein
MLIKIRVPKVSPWTLLTSARTNANARAKLNVSKKSSSNSKGQKYLLAGLIVTAF